MTNIKTQPKTAFGRTLHYVIDPVQQDALQSLTGKKTLTETDITCLQQYPSTINYKRKSKFIKSNSNTNKTHKKVGWVLNEIHNQLDLWDLCGIAQVLSQSQIGLL